MAKKYIVDLTSAEREQLLALVEARHESVRTRRRARLLLDADCGAEGLSDQEISELRRVSVPTVARARQIYAQEGLAAALTFPPGPVRVRKLSAEQAAQLRALAASQPPAGHRRWSLRLLAEQMVAREIVADISYETVRRVLKAARR